MSNGYYNSDELLTSIKVRAAVPASQITFKDTDLLRFAQEETDLKIVPSVLSVKEEFYVTLTEIPLVANQTGYPVPYRAIGSKVRAVFYKPDNFSGSLIPLAQMPIDHLPMYQNGQFQTLYLGVYMQNDEITLVPDVGPNPNGSLSVRYYLKPNQLVEMSRAGRIKSIDRSTGVIQVAVGTTNTNNVPNNINVTTQIDFIQARPGHKTYKFDIDPVAVNTAGGTITFNPSDIPDKLVVGDWVCSAGETVIPQIPSELHVMLAQAVACRVLEALGDTQGLQNANVKLQEMEVKLLSLIDSRIEAPGKKITLMNGLLGYGRYNNRRRY